MDIEELKFSKAVESLAIDEDLFDNKAERIVQDLNRITRKLFRRGYGIAKLVFSDNSLVSTTDSGVISEVVELLRAGAQPQGFIAPTTTATAFHS